MKKTLVAASFVALSFGVTANANAWSFPKIDFGGAFNAIKDRVSAAVKPVVAHVQEFAVGSLNVIKDAAKTEATGFRASLVQAARGFMAKELSTLKDLGKKAAPEVLGLLKNSALKGWAAAKAQFLHGMKAGKGKGFFGNLKFGFSSAAKGFFGAFGSNFKKGALPLGKKYLGMFKKDFRKNFRDFRGHVVKAGVAAGKGFWGKVKKGIPRVAKMSFKGRARRHR